MKRALISRDGANPDFHDPVKTTDRFARLLEKNGFGVDVFDDFKCFEDPAYIREHDLIVLSWTIADDRAENIGNIVRAVEDGVGLAGCHGGLCDAFRMNTDWQYVTGGQWVAHPGNDGVTYGVEICGGKNPVTEGVRDFTLRSEQYYLHVDPGVDVLATTTFRNNTCGRDVVMPAAWTKYYGKGRVFYLSVGHTDGVFDEAPEAEKLMERGMLWAARAL